MATPDKWEQPKEEEEDKYNLRGLVVAASRAIAQVNRNFKKILQKLKKEQASFSKMQDYCIYPLHKYLLNYNNIPCDNELYSS